MNLPYATDLVPLAIGIGAVVLLIGAILFVVVAVKGEMGAAEGLVITLAVLFVAGFASSAPFVVSHSSSIEARKAWMDETYGIQFSAAQYAELEFPSVSEPTEERKVYGLTTGNRDNQLVTVQLVWQDDQFVLIGDDGKQLDALATR